MDVSCRRAALSGHTPGALGDGYRSRRHVRIIKHQRRINAAQFERQDDFRTGTQSSCQGQSGGAPSYGGNRRDRWMRHQRLRHVSAAVNHPTHRIESRCREKLSV